MPSEWAMEKTKKIVEQWDINDSMEPLIAEEIDAARAQGRREGLEEAIVAIERHEKPIGASHWVFDTSTYGKAYSDGRVTGKTVAIDAIRAAIAKEPKA